MNQKNQSKFLEHLNNLGLFLVNIFLGFVGMSLLEYEVAKIRNPQVVFLPTPPALISLISELMLMFSIISISMLVIIYYKKLENRRWLWWLTFVSFALFVVAWFTLGTTRLDIILFG